MKIWKVENWYYENLEDGLNDLSKNGFRIFTIFEIEGKETDYYTVIAFKN